MGASVAILMGSKSDLEHVNQIGSILESFGIPYEMRVASAHKSVRHLLGAIEAYADAEGPMVFIAVAGRSNALAGMLDANTAWPVITSPPVSSSFAGADIYSSLRMPSGVAPMVVLDPKGAALAAVKILAAGDPALQKRVSDYQTEMTAAILAADESLR